MVIKQFLLKGIEAKATSEANSRGFSDYATSELVCEAVDIVEDFFAYITWAKVVDEIIQSKNSVIELHHRLFHEFESYWKYLELDREKCAPVSVRAHTFQIRGYPYFSSQ